MYGVDESFIAMATAVTAPEAQPYLEVVAPATLPEVSCNGAVFLLYFRVWLMSGLYMTYCM